MNSDLPVFRRPTPVERAFNRAHGFLVGLGVGSCHNDLLEVRGRTAIRRLAARRDFLEPVAPRCAGQGFAGTAGAGIFSGATERALRPSAPSR